VFAVGYPLDGVEGRSVAQMREGLQSVTPLALAWAGDRGLDRVPAFVTADEPRRAPLGLRYAAWLAGAHPGPEAELARYEASLRAAGGDAEAVALGQGTGLRWASGARAERFPFDVAAFAEKVDAGETVAPDPGEVSLVFGRSGGDPVVVEVPPGVVDDPAAADPETRATLVELGLLVAERWSE
jgi:hypothetical protein